MLSFFRFFVLIFLLPAAYSVEGLACSCGGEPLRPGVPIEQIRKEKREYFLNEFKGAAFIGRIVKRENVSMDRAIATENGETVFIEYYKYTIRVTEYWFGVDSKTIVVYGEPDKKKNRGEGTSSCGFTLKKGRTYFFTPHRYKNDLEIQLCDFAGGGSDPNEYPATEFRKIMGPPKTF